MNKFFTFIRTWSFSDREALITLCNAIDRTFLLDRLPNPYTEADADWWLRMVAENDGKNGIWRAIEAVRQIVGSISVERPSAIGAHYQGEWAIYSTSMLSAALVNTAIIYPDTREETVSAIDSLIRITMSPELRWYDASTWGEDPLETLSGNKSHISYISLLAWMISGYKTIGGDERYDSLFDSLCEAMARRLKSSPNFNVTTFPGSTVFIPDVLVAIVALSNYGKLNGGKYRDVVDGWLTNMKTNHMDPKTGLIASVLRDSQRKGKGRALLGSYTSLSVYFLTFVDEEFAREQYAGRRHCRVEFENDLNQLGL